MASLNYTVRLCQVKKERKEKRMGGREGAEKGGKGKKIRILCSIGLKSKTQKKIYSVI